MLIQVLSLTQDQINGLPPSERDAIQALVCPGAFLLLISSHTHPGPAVSGTSSWGVLLRKKLSRPKIFAGLG